MDDNTGNQAFRGLARDGKKESSNFVLQQYGWAGADGSRANWTLADKRTEGRCGRNPPFRFGAVRLTKSSSSYVRATED